MVNQTRNKVRWDANDQGINDHSKYTNNFQHFRPYSCRQKNNPQTQQLHTNSCFCVVSVALSGRKCSFCGSFLKIGCLSLKQHKRPWNACFPWLTNVTGLPGNKAPLIADHFDGIQANLNNVIQKGQKGRQRECSHKCGGEAELDHWGAQRAVGNMQTKQQPPVLKAENKNHATSIVVYLVYSMCDIEQQLMLC